MILVHQCGYSLEKYILKPSLKMKNLIIHLLFFRWVQSISFFRKRLFSNTRKLATTPILCSQKVSHQCCLAMKSRPPFGVISHSFRAKKQTSPHYIELLPFSVIHFNCMQCQCHQHQQTAQLLGTSEVRWQFGQCGTMVTLETCSRQISTNLL